MRWRSCAESDLLKAIAHVHRSAEFSDEASKFQVALLESGSPSLQPVNVCNLSLQPFIVGAHCNNASGRGLCDQNNFATQSSSVADVGGRSGQRANVEQPWRVL